eukprot:5217980-Amphidinium_carterae.1
MVHGDLFVHGRGLHSTRVDNFGEKKTRPWTKDKRKSNKLRPTGPLTSALKRLPWGFKDT